MQLSTEFIRDHTRLGIRKRRQLTGFLFARELWGRQLWRSFAGRLGL